MFAREKYVCVAIIKYTSKPRKLYSLLPMSGFEVLLWENSSLSKTACYEKAAHNKVKSSFSRYVVFKSSFSRVYRRLRANVSRRQAQKNDFFDKLW